jgi:hypothetical protein
MNAKVILVELNEVPYRVIDAYCKRRPYSALARVLDQSEQFETVTEDKYVLDPWVSWPTLHRGVTDETHNILHLGQVLTETDVRYPPIWRLLRERGARVGVFGSLHSSSIPADVQEYCFYLPDYFDSEVFAHPARLRPFQELNLAMTRQSARNVTRRIPLSAVAKFIASARQMGITASTVKSSLGQLAGEVFNPASRIRRRSYQPIIMADIFMQQLERERPDFSTFYTNHVAAAMHRYWGATFPEDYRQPLESTWISKYSAEIFFAMDKFDLILARLVNFIHGHPEFKLMIASSMGQAAIATQKTYQFLTIVDMPKFMQGFGVPADGWELRPAMVPCRCVVVKDEYRQALLFGLNEFVIGGASMIVDKRPMGPMSYDERERGFFQFFIQFDNYEGDGSAQVASRSMTFDELGLGMMAHEDGVNCTAQHVPIGSLLVYRHLTDGLRPSRRKQISTLDVAPSLLHAYGIAKPEYMPGTVSIELAH